MVSILMQLNVNLMPLFIDITLSDGVLVEEFKDFLLWLRQAMPHRRDITNVREVDFKDWYEKGVLPYLDLQILEKLGLPSITGPAFVEALGSIVDESRADSIDINILKTTKLYALQLIETDLLRNLLSQAQREKKGLRKEVLKFTPAKMLPPKNKTRKNK